MLISRSKTQCDHAFTSEWIHSERRFLDIHATESLEDMLEFGNGLIQFARGRGAERAEIERMRYLAIERLFEVIGEALSRVLVVEPDLAAKIPDVSEIRGMCNRLVHEYDGIKVEVVWDAAENDVPILNSVVSKILREHGAI